MTIPATYTRTAIFLHWLIAALILVNIGLIYAVGYLPDGDVRPAVNTHKSIGITVLGLALMRWLWRGTHVPPPLPTKYGWWERFASHFVHALLYLIILALPISGWLHDSAWKDAAAHPMYLFGVIPWPRIGAVMTLDPVLKERLHDQFGLMHRLFGYALYGALALHIGGALKHQFIDREPELERMMPPRRRGATG